MFLEEGEGGPFLCAEGKALPPRLAEHLRRHKTELIVLLGAEAARSSGGTPVMSVGVSAMPPIYFGSVAPENRWRPSERFRVSEPLPAFATPGIFDLARVLAADLGLDAESVVAAVRAAEDRQFPTGPAPLASGRQTQYPGPMLLLAVDVAGRLRARRGAEWAALWDGERAGGDIAALVAWYGLCVASGTQVYLSAVDKSAAAV